MGRPRGPRLSVAPLDAALAHFNIDVEFIEGRLNNAIRNARARGYVTATVADEVACHVLKMHPIAIWGEEYVEEIHPDLGAFDDIDLLPDEEAA